MARSLTRCAATWAWRSSSGRTSSSTTAASSSSYCTSRIARYGKRCSARARRRLQACCALELAAKAGQLRFPVVLVNDARCKYLFDNVHGTGQSVWDGVMRTTNLVLAGKTVVIVGYGWCGKGFALRAQGLGAHVVVCEVDPIKAADALMHGCRVLPLADACRARGRRADRDRRAAHAARRALRAAQEQCVARERGPLLGGDRRRRRSRKRPSSARSCARTSRAFSARRRWLNLLGGGNIVNISCGDGHPAEIMDMSFALQALAARHVVEHAGSLEAECYPVPAVDRRAGRTPQARRGRHLDRHADERTSRISRRLARLRDR